MEKNVASQKWRVFAFNRTDNTPKTGDAANITAKIAKDWGSKTGTNDVNPAEIEDGYYEFDLTQAESNAKNLDLYPESSTADIQIIGVPGNIVPMPINHTAMGIESDGDLTKVNLVATTTVNTDMVGTDNAALASVATEARLAELDPANMPADIDAIPTTAMRGTDGANTVVPMTAALSQTEHDASQSLISAIPTNPNTVVPMTAALSQTEHDSSQSAIAALNDLSKSDVAKSFKDTDVASTNPAAGSLFENVVGSSTVDELQERMNITGGVITKTILGKTQKYIVLYTQTGAAAGTRNFQKELLGALIGGFDDTGAAVRQYLPTLGFYQQDGAGNITEINGIAADLGVTAILDLLGAGWGGAAADESTAGAGYSTIHPFVDGYTAPTSNLDLRIIYPRAIGQAALESSSMTDWTTAEKEQIRHRINIDGDQTAPTAGGAAKMAGTDADLTLKSLIVVQTGANLPAVSYTGKGTGAGLLTTSEATGHGIEALSGPTGGDGLNATSRGGAGHGISATGNDIGHGIRTISGNGGSGDGINATSGGPNGRGIFSKGTGSGAGIFAQGGNTSGHGMELKGDGTGHGLSAISGGSGTSHGIFASGSGTGDGIHAQGGSTAGHGIFAKATLAGSGEFSGIYAEGDDTGHGIRAVSGDGATGDGIKATSQATTGNGISATGAGATTGVGIKAVGGQAGINAVGTGSGHGILASSGSTGGHGIQASATLGSGGSGIKAIGDGVGHGLELVSGATAGAKDLSAKEIGAPYTLADGSTAASIADMLSEMAEISAGAGAYARAVDSLEAQSGNGGAVLLQTTINGIPTSNTVFVLTAGAPDDSAYDGCLVIITDASTANQKAVGVVQAWDQASLTLTLLRDDGIFTFANGDAITIIAAKELRLQQTLEGTVMGEVNAIPGSATSIAIKNLTNSEADMTVADVLKLRVLTFRTGVLQGKSVSISAQSVVAAGVVTLTVSALVNFANVAVNDRVEFT